MTARSEFGVAKIALRHRPPAHVAKAIRSISAGDFVAGSPQMGLCAPRNPD
jgi:hypothetical protein